MLSGQSKVIPLEGRNEAACDRVLPGRLRLDATQEAFLKCWAFLACFYDEKASDGDKNSFRVRILNS